MPYKIVKSGPTGYRVRSATKRLNKNNKLSFKYYSKKPMTRKNAEKQLNILHYVDYVKFKKSIRK